MMVDLNLVNRVTLNFWVSSFILSKSNIELLQILEAQKLKWKININFVMVNHAYLNCKKEEEVGDALLK